jgi:hypothetical protein
MIVHTQDSLNENGATKTTVVHFLLSSVVPDAQLHWNHDNASGHQHVNYVELPNKAFVPAGSPNGSK